MSRVETVEDPEDPRLIDYREIRDAERRRQSGTFIAEGREVVRRLLRTRRYAIRSALVTPPALAALGPALAADGVHTYLVRQDIVKAIVGIEFHHGCLVVGERGTDAAPEAVLAEAAGKSLVVLEELGDASNVGAMFRNALAFGAGAVFLSPGTADPLYRREAGRHIGVASARPSARERRGVAAPNQKPPPSAGTVAPRGRANNHRLHQDHPAGYSGRIGNARQRGGMKKGFTSLPRGALKFGGENHHEITVVAPTGFAT